MSGTHTFFGVSLRVRRHDLLPELDGKVEPSFGTRADTGTEAVTDVPVAVELHFYARPP
jgi:hypothetical protein